MRNTALTTAIAAAAVLTLSACSGTEPEESTGTEAPTSSAEFNDADVAYASGMLQHHEQAIEMSDIVLEKPDLDAEVADLAENIKAAQGPEIEQMNAWLAEWGEEQDSAGDEGGHGGHGGDDEGHEGMMSEEDLAELEAAGGPDASRLFLEQMIEHHEGAVEMAQAHLEEGAAPEALELSENVIADQNAEIEEMRGLLERIS